MLYIYIYIYVSELFVYIYEFLNTKINKYKNTGSVNRNHVFNFTVADCTIYLSILKF